MKKLFFAVFAIALLVSCREAELSTENDPAPVLKKTDTNEFIKPPTDTDTTGVGPVVVIPPR